MGLQTARYVPYGIQRHIAVFDMLIASTFSQPGANVRDELTELYRTERGRLLVERAEHVLPKLDDESVDLVITSPPFALLRQKPYGNFEQSEYVDWLVSFGPQVKRALKNSGSFVIDLGGAYQRGKPVRSLYSFRALLRLCDDCGFHLAEEFYWHNPAKLPSPIEWVNKRKIRAKDSVNTVWWLSKTESPKSDVRRVLVPYSDRMRKLIEDPEKFYRPKDRPSGHEISSRFSKDNGVQFRATSSSIPIRKAIRFTFVCAKSSGLNRILCAFPKRCQNFSSIS